MKTNIVIVGGGASCISFIDAILKKKFTAHSKNLSLTILEKSNEVGPGNAYLNDSKSNILNTKAGYITVFKDYPSDFYDWQKCNEYKWKSYFPNLKITPDTYVPRALFGIYMKDAFSYIVATAAHQNIKIKIIQEEATNIQQVEKNQVNVITKSGAVIVANKVVLACGTQHQHDMNSLNRADIINTPYPTSSLKKKISTDDNIAIIGARLSAIDATITLFEGGHTGQITIYSRSGYFPFVRGIQGRYKNDYLTPTYTSKYCPTLDFLKLNELYQMECERYKMQSSDDYFEDLPIPTGPIVCLEKFLTTELTLSKQNRGWQAILYDTNACIDQLWDCFSTDDKEIFMKEYFSVAMSLRVSIPAENAKKILGYLRSGKLKFLTGPSVVEVKEGQLNVLYKGVSKRVNKVIYATGTPKSLNQIDSTLIKNLLENRGVENKFGGLDVCKKNYGLIEKEGNMSTNIFAIGEITSGRFLFTSALDIIIRHAHACADSMEKLITVSDSSESLVKPRS